ncbi:arginine--tRNA ligase, chloroplastic/mitochondrial [Tanacetum coccineum]|uniref:Arginine--tRNA ligase, chloroplastic/mitochondrial n=1 Tax=Tanacetum coccineum TaxID=301880 RepID=A0ABQ5ANF9_9ASTR
MIYRQEELMKIKNNLELLRPEMIERAPRVFDVGFVTIKLSGKWMAKSLHKMLRDGIDTWAPKLLIESVKVNFPSCDMADLVPMDLLRRELIKETSISMLKYCKIDVEFSKPCEIALPKEEKDKFWMEEKDGDVLIFRNPGGEQEPLIHAMRDGWSGINPMDDLADLWYGLRGEKADWIVCATPVQQQEYLKMCIKAAQHAGWLPLHIRDSPRASYTGFQILNTKLEHENLSSLLDKAKSSCEADHDVREAMMFGQIGISDGYSALWDEWGLTDAPDHGFVGLFDHDWSNPVDITSGRPNGRCISCDAYTFDCQCRYVP